MKTKTRKILAALLAAAVLFVTAGCGAKDDGQWEWLAYTKTGASVARKRVGLTSRRCGACG